MLFTFTWGAFNMGLVLVLSLLAKFLWTGCFFDAEKNAPFECGFEPLSRMRIPFSIRFFLLLIVFLIFDIEIALVFPILYMLKQGASLALGFSLLFFLVILLGGLFHEWNEGSLSWSQN